MYIEKLLNGSQYYFLSRPRRFGKSLFLSMLKFFFEGRRDLFKGLYADTIDWDWHPRPVIYLDFNTRQYSSDEDIDRLLNQFLTEHENKFGIKNQSEDYSARFANLIRTMAEKTGYNVIILVDEYDKPLVNNINNPQRLELFRNTLASLYSNFKSSADYLQMVFLTGVCRLGKLSVFSGLNNISDISFDRRFDAICGITRDELIDNFRLGIEELAYEQGSAFETELTKLQQWYDGYHFTQKCPDLYNPFSILNALSKKMYGNYWISSGTPTLLVEQLKRRHSDLEKLLTSRCGQSDLEGLDIDNIQPLPLFYQTGYLTIKSYDSKYDIYTLGLPNEEVKRGFFEYILPFYGNLN